MRLARAIPLGSSWNPKAQDCPSLGMCGVFQHGRIQLSMGPVCYSSIPHCHTTVMVLHYQRWWAEVSARSPLDKLKMAKLSARSRYWLKILTYFSSCILHFSLNNNKVSNSGYVLARPRTSFWLAYRYNSFSKIKCQLWKRYFMWTKQAWEIVSDRAPILLDLTWMEMALW